MKLRAINNPSRQNNKVLELKMRETQENLNEFVMEMGFSCDMSTFEILSIEEYKVFHMDKPSALPSYDTITPDFPKLYDIDKPNKKP